MTNTTTNQELAREHLRRGCDAPEVQKDQESVNTPDPVAPVEVSKDSLVAETEQLLLAVLQRGFTLWHSYKAGDYQLHLKFQTIGETQKAHTLLRVLSNPEGSIGSLIIRELHKLDGLASAPDTKTVCINCKCRASARKMEYCATCGCKCEFPAIQPRLNDAGQELAVCKNCGREIIALSEPPYPRNWVHQNPHRNYPVNCQLETIAEPSELADNISAEAADAYLRGEGVVKRCEVCKQDATLTNRFVTRLMERHAQVIRDRDAAYRRGLEAAVNATCGYCREGWPFRPGSSSIHFDMGAIRVCLAENVRALIEPKGGE